MTTNKIGAVDGGNSSAISTQISLGPSGPIAKESYATRSKLQSEFTQRGLEPPPNISIQRCHARLHGFESSLKPYSCMKKPVRSHKFTVLFRPTVHGL
jgi:hypothetical protein